MSAAYAVINLSAVKHNIEIAKEYAPKAKLMAVIKANAYGHGLLRIAKALTNVDAFAVARVDEAIQLRKAGYNNRILILEGFVCEQELKSVVQYDLDVVIHSIGQVDVLEKQAGPHKISAWLKLDTGMNRLGFKAVEFKHAYQRLLKCSNVNQPISLMTHFSSADDTENKVTEKQIKLFHQFAKCCPGEESLANSAAIIAWPNSIADWVRPGIMLYGVSPFSDQDGKELGLEPVMSLHSQLISVKTIEAGEAVGYAGTWVSKIRTRVGVVAIGYGDGYPRSAKPGTPVLVNGKIAPLIGRVSMDMITVDLTAYPKSRAGDSVILWGENLPIEEVANCADTIPYTLLCGVTQRVKFKSIYPA